MATDRLFLALRPDAVAAARIQRLALRLRLDCGLRGRPLPVERLHLTLCFLGDHAGLPPQLLAAANMAAGAVHTAPFELDFDQARSFPHAHGASPLVLCRSSPSEALGTMHDTLCAVVARSGCFPPDGRQFEPHVTLLYDEQVIAPCPVEPISWTVTEMLLIRSLIGRGQHEVLARYRLNASSS